ncbi:large ribosomal subunit protein bL35m-like [Trichechus inunguis]
MTSRFACLFRLTLLLGRALLIAADRVNEHRRYRCAARVVQTERGRRSEGAKMAAFTVASAVRAASGILRPLNILASSAYQTYAKKACLISALSTRCFSHIQMPVVSSAPRLTTPVGNLTCRHTTIILNR